MIEIFQELAMLFNKNGFRLYMIGGTSRDYLLNKKIDDIDLVSDATPDEMKTFLENASYTFARFGTVRVKYQNQHIDITTLRVEDGYLDFRHPGKIKFVKSLEEDYARRDFTINAIYIDENFKIHDFSGGLDDLKNKIIRFIGDPTTRIKEDPLRILRAIRFQKKLGFSIEENTLKAIQENSSLLNELNIDKVKEEIRKLEKEF